MSHSQELATSPEGTLHEEEMANQADLADLDYGDGETSSVHPAMAPAIAPNTLRVTCSWSLMNHLRGMARNEGVSLEDLALELLSESAAKRAFEDQRRPAPSHLMTRTGYVPQTDPHNQQPHMTHHEGNWGEAGYGSGRASYNRSAKNGQQNFNQKNNNRYPPRRPHSGNRG